MKNFLISLILIFNLSSLNIVNAETKIRYLDLDKVLLKSLAGKSINDKIIKMQKNNFNKFKEEEKKFIENEKLILSQKNVLEKNQYEKKVLSFKKDIDTYNLNKSKLIKAVNSKRLKATSKLLEVLNPLLANYSSEESIGIIIQKKNIIIGKSELDITDDIINLLNEKIKKIDLK